MRDGIYTRRGAEQRKCMMQILTILRVVALLVSAGVRGQDTCLGTVKEAFERAYVRAFVLSLTHTLNLNLKIPGNISMPFDPSVLLHVTYSNATLGVVKTVQAGMQLQIAETWDAPTYRLVGKHVGPYVVMLLDLDAPTVTNHTWSSIVHFMGSDYYHDANLLSSATQPVGRYLSPKPFADLSLHRYVFLVFDQPEGFDRQTMFAGDGSQVARFDVSAFAEGTGLGRVIGGTYMVVGAADVRSV